MKTRTDHDWAAASLLALDLDGSGAQDRDDEAILEIAVVPFADGQPDSACSTLVNPGARSPSGRGSHRD